MNILITGGTGFLGKHLVEKLSENNNLFLITRNSNNIKIKNQNINIIEQDLFDLKLTDDIIQKIDIVIHLAAINNPENYELMYKTNVEVTRKLADFFLNSNIKNFIHLSSVAVNNGYRNEIIKYDLPYYNKDKYGFTKIKAEIILKKYKEKGLPVSIIRPALIYSKKDKHFTALLNKIKKINYPIVVGSNYYWHLCNVKNIVFLINKLIEDKKVLKYPFIVADRKEIKIKKIFRILCKRFKIKQPYYINICVFYFFCLINNIISKFNRKINIKSNLVLKFANNEIYDINLFKNYMNDISETEKELNSFI